MPTIPFNKPFLTGKETHYIEQAVALGQLSGDGEFTRRCHLFFEHRYRFNKVLLTTSCTDALEMSAILINTQPDDEIIVPSYTFVSCANAFVLRGAKIVFADSEMLTPNIDAQQIEKLITPRTKAIVVVHYAGIACQMEQVMQVANKHNLFVIEDAAHSIDSFYHRQPLGSFGHLATFSFHETKNVIAGEGGMLAINDPQFNLRAEIIREKGTNRTSFFRGEVAKYEWVDIGSSFLPSELNAAFLFAQLEQLTQIQQKRIALWQRYYANLTLPDAPYRLPYLPNDTHCNGHLFYLVCPDNATRTRLIAHLQTKGIQAVFHYLPLHLSPYYSKQHGKLQPTLPNCERFAHCLLRLPLFYELSFEEVDYISEQVMAFFACR
ncbi:MAG TPA: dTDP-4-amino-4,6-dideoxygalactose transaminase [Chitinophagales bacterium]|nr:dTDP-4-amino-4,6-dideoxygalactose transaminase [Chitinophagales bacterium]HRK28210.1 dTDP-4-amino-4,6-dideoxygalactose transaminase [Chitinophagales bacterium]